MNSLLYPHLDTGGLDSNNVSFLATTDVSFSIASVSPLTPALRHQPVPARSLAPRNKIQRFIPSFIYFYVPSYSHKMLLYCSISSQHRHADWASPTSPLAQSTYGCPTRSRYGAIVVMSGNFCRMVRIDKLRQLLHTTHKAPCDAQPVSHSTFTSSNPRFLDSSLRESIHYCPITTAIWAIFLTRIQSFESFESFDVRSKTSQSF